MLLLLQLVVAVVVIFVVVASNAELLSIKIILGNAKKDFKTITRLHF